MSCYKLYVPEIAEYNWHGLHNGDVPYTTIARHDIHVLLQQKMIELGWVVIKDFSSYSIDDPYVFLTPDGTAFTERQKRVFDNCDFKEISWLAFIEFTPEDIDDIEVVADSELNEVSQSKKEDIDNNEKALHHAIKLMSINARDAGYARGLLSGFLLCFDNDLKIRDIETLKLCIQNSKEFLEVNK